MTADKDRHEHREAWASWRGIAFLWVALIVLVGPSFGPIARILRERFELRAAAGWLVLLMVIQYAFVAAAAWLLIRRRGGTAADLGLVPCRRWGPLLVGTLVGILWSFAGVGALIDQGMEVDLAEFSRYRLAMAGAGALGALLEDVLVRGYLMNALRQLGVGAWGQVLHSSLLFAVYHAVWNLASPAQAIPALIASFIYALILGGLFLWGRRSLAPVAAAHSLALLLGEPFLTWALVLSA